MVDKNLLRHLAKKYPDVKSATEEIVNRNAILSLPKGTEYFFSDLHGEHEAFIHMLKSASGVIRSHIEEIFGPDLTREEREELAALVYNADAEIKRQKKNSDLDFNKWCMESIMRSGADLQGGIHQVHEIQGKKTVAEGICLHHRRTAPCGRRREQEQLLRQDHQYHCRVRDRRGIHRGNDEGHQLTGSRSSAHYRGYLGQEAHPDLIMDFLLDYHDVDFQWGNHDIVWMGAATGNWACITNVLRMNISYNNFDMLEIGYGINLRPLATMAENIYGDDPCEFFKPKRLDENKFDPVDDSLASKMNKAIAICQFKVEGQRIMAHPEYHMENRLLLDKIDFEKGTVQLRDGEFPLRDTNFPTIDPEHPYELTQEERDVLNALEASFLQSEKLQKHIRFLYSHGALYTVRQRQSDVSRLHSDRRRRQVRGLHGQRSDDYRQSVTWTIWTNRFVRLISHRISHKKRADRATSCGICGSAASRRCSVRIR